MGKLNIETKPLIVSHFSHHHPLELTKLIDITTTTTTNATTTCAGCGLAVASGTDFFSCNTCGYALHRLCSGLPNKMHHPCHNNHELSLHDSGVVAFHCKACARTGTGFSYNCHVCGIAFHVLCTILPLSLAHQAHSHPLKLEFSPPYIATGAFHCDVCGTTGSNHWLYRCDQCEYDVHLGCAIASRNSSCPPLSSFSNVQASPDDNNSVGRGAQDMCQLEGKIGFSDGSSSSTDHSTEGLKN